MQKKVQLILVAVFLCVSAKVNAQDDLSLQAILIDSVLTKNANAIVRSEDIVITINSINSVTVKTKRVVTVLNKHGNGFADSYEGYTPSRRIKKLEVKVYNATGQEIKKYKKKDFKDRSMQDGFSLMRDDRMKYFEYTPISYPYTLSFESEVESFNTAYLPSWRPVLAYYLSLEKSSFKILNPTNISIRFKELNFKEYPINVTKNDQNTLYELSNISSKTPEVNSPSFNDLIPIVKVAMDNFSYEGLDGTASNWETLGKWQYEKLLQGRNQLEPETIQKISELVKGVDTNKEKAKLIYKYVQDKTRYISVQLGVGGWMPFSASDVDRLGYGDCKALTNYTKALLDSQNIESYYTLVFAKDRKDIDSDFASLQGNHAILFVPNGEEDIWLECTSQTAPFNFIGDFTDDRNVLVVKPSGGEIKRTKKYTTEENTLHTMATISLQPDASIEAEVTSVSKGLQYDWRYLIKLESVKDQKLYFKEYWDHINNLNILSMDLEDDKDNIEYQEKVKINARNYATNAGSRLLVIPNVFNRLNGKMTKYKDRKTSLVISKGYVDTDEYIINIPAGYSINKLPEAKVFETVFGMYKSSLEKIDESTLKYSRTLRINDGSYPKEKYEEYRKFMSKIRNADKSKIVLKQQ